MNEQKKMEAMARADGRWQKDVIPEKWTELGDGTVKVEEELGHGSSVSFFIPDYTTDNEICRMVRGLDKEDRENYTHELMLVMRTTDEIRRGVKPANLEDIIELLYRAIVATPAQKVEAYLKAIGSWVEDAKEGE